MPQEDLRSHLRAHLETLARLGVNYVTQAQHDTTNQAVPATVVVDTQSKIIEPRLIRVPQRPVIISESLFQAVPTGATVPESLEDRRRALEQVAKEVQSCEKCPDLFATRTQTVFGVGPPDAELVFIGEGPGSEEDRLGEPFVGPSGQLLDKMILAMGMKREACYIMNVVKCRPPGNRQPEPSECLNCRPYFDRQLELLSPRVIVCLGGVAAQNLLQTKVGIMKLRGTWQKYGKTPVMPTYHPAALLRNPAWKKDAWEDLKAVLTLLGRPIPGRT